jgi:hypothetical protein
LEEIKFQNFKISKFLNIISFELAKVLGYVAGIVRKCRVGFMETMKIIKIIGGPFKL